MAARAKVPCNFQERLNDSTVSPVTMFMDMLCRDAFKILLKQVAGQNMKTSLIKEIRKYYKYKITFDVFVHAVHHVRVMSEFGLNLVI